MMQNFFGAGETDPLRRPSSFMAKPTTREVVQVHAIA
jgi:hypothetical protein